MKASGVSVDLDECDNQDDREDQIRLPDSAAIDGFKPEQTLASAPAPLPRDNREIAMRGFTKQSRAALRLPLWIATAHLVLVAGVLTVAPPAAAAPTSCPEHFASGDAPDIIRPSLAAQITPLCFEGYAVLHSGVSRTPLAVAEHLTRARMAAARETRREGNFHEEDRLPADARARLADYARSGFDRGHMAPAGDMGTSTSMAESFSLANMVPQDPGSNRCLWEGIETSVRRLAADASDVYVVTGPIFAGETLQRLNDRVLVPTSLYKAVYIPRRGAAAYVVENAPGMAWRAVSISELRQITGIEVFPGVAATTRDRLLTLPEPQPNNVRGACERQDEVAGAGSGTGTQARRTNPTVPASPPQPSRGSSSAWVVLIMGGIFAVVMVVLLVRVLGRR
jgi:endonuclease G